jgi:hypothetical protein
MSHKEPKGPKAAGQTAKFVLCITLELKKRVKDEAKKNFGERKGAESLWVEQALRLYLHMNVPGVKET